MRGLRILPAMALGLCMGMLQTGCGSDPSGTDEGKQDGTYMVAQMNGKPWRGVEVYYFVKPTEDPASNSASLIGGLNLVSFWFSLATDRPDSVALETIFGKNFGGFEQDGNRYYTQSGYIKINRVSSSQVEGTFACDMVATDDSGEPRKAMHVTDGKFLAKVAVLPR
ncbi:MAG: hypothetical protein ABIW76_14005 [Fibrobacteria bacterium]